MEVVMKKEKPKQVAEKQVTDLKIKKLTVRSGVKGAMGCNPCHTPGHLSSVADLSLSSISAISAVSAIKVIK
jgi:hypothetical protein